jgi:hypothetical protein
MCSSRTHPTDRGIARRLASQRVPGESPIPSQTALNELWKANQLLSLLAAGTARREALPCPAGVRLSRLIGGTLLKSTVRRISERGWRALSPYRWVTPVRPGTDHLMHGVALTGRMAT